MSQVDQLFGLLQDRNDNKEMDVVQMRTLLNQNKVRWGWQLAPKFPPSLF